VDATSTPLFTTPDAERLIGAPAASARRWLAGHEFSHEGQIRSRPPRLGPSATFVDGVLLMSFLDLVEVQLARTLRTRGVGWPKVIDTARFLREQWHAQHPFALSRLKTDGREIFAEYGRISGDSRLLQLGKNQFAFEEIMRDSLFDVLDFREDGIPWRLWPRGRDAQIVVDPARAFGRPILDTYGVPVSSLAAAYAANDNDISRVAKWFDIPVSAVEAAVRYDAGPRLAA
jgi:uncharacterized protein (DUF433 family)